MYRLDISISFQSDELQGQYVPGSAMETPPFSRTEYQKPVYTNPSYENTHIYIYISHSASGQKTTFPTGLLLINYNEVSKKWELMH